MNNLYSYRHDIPQLIQEINHRSSEIEVPDLVPSDLVETYQICRVLDEFILDYFAEPRSKISEPEIHESIERLFKEFKENILIKLLREKEDFIRISSTRKKGFKNIFEFAQCQNLYLSNRYVNLISENLGHILEDIACISPCVFSPDKIINMKIKGVDLIIFNQGYLRYTQLKTKKDTLTGSQSDRSINELKIHQYSIFAAALDMGNSWTLSSTAARKHNISRIAGREFWSLLGLDYEIILHKLGKIVRQIEEELYRD
jgi:hypothetical protein